MVDVLFSPFTWLAMFFVGIFFTSWRLEKALKLLGIQRSSQSQPAPKTGVIVRNGLVAAVLTIAVWYLLNGTSLTIALAVIFAGFLYFWRESYVARIRPLVAAGLPGRSALGLTLLQVVWLGPLFAAFALFALARYSAP